LELGSEAKIKLMMHLLSEAQTEEGIDARIPHLNEVTELIDKEVLANMSLWKGEVLSSGYLSKNILMYINDSM
jgi:hypothetical protein